MAPAITVRNVSKHFTLGHGRYPSLKERVIHLGRETTEEFYALRDIDFEVEEGTTVGLLGHNGSGKSTLLKCIAGILRPNAGEITTRGRLAALLELGAGFQSELTGRENVFLNGLILGMSRKELERRFDAIVAFSEIEQFIDTQVRFYSSGMYVRLGFAIAVNVDPDILLVDEVLAVGDEAFQRKCLDRVKEFQDDGRTIVVVTHAADLVTRICQSAIVLDRGQLVTAGDPEEAVKVFREHLRVTPQKAKPGEPPPLDDRVRITHVEFDAPSKDDIPVVDWGDPLTIRASYTVDAPAERPVFTLWLHDRSGARIFSASSSVSGVDTGVLRGPGVAVFEFDRVPSAAGRYAITLAVTSTEGDFIYDWHEQRYPFDVRDPNHVDEPDELAVEIRLEKSPTPTPAL
jgi:ABC-2 type transport system ATP-binding protein